MSGPPRARSTRSACHSVAVGSFTPAKQSGNLGSLRSPAPWMSYSCAGQPNEAVGSASRAAAGPPPPRRRGRAAAHHPRRLRGLGAAPGQRRRRAGPGAEPPGPGRGRSGPVVPTIDGDGVLRFGDGVGVDPAGRGPPRRGRSSTGSAPWSAATCSAGPVGRTRSRGATRSTCTCSGCVAASSRSASRCGPCGPAATCSRRRSQRGRASRPVLACGQHAHAPSMGLGRWTSRARSGTRVRNGSAMRGERVTPSTRPRKPALVASSTIQIPTRCPLCTTRASTRIGSTSTNTATRLRPSRSTTQRV